MMYLKLSSNRFGNRYFENMNPEEEVPGKPKDDAGAWKSDA
jgi:hypothetical protein